MSTNTTINEMIEMQRHACYNTPIQECETKQCAECMSHVFYNNGYRRQNEVIKNLLLEIKGIIDRTGEGVGIYDITKLAQKYNVTLEEPNE
jgi:hypothetical protein